MTESQTQTPELPLVRRSGVKHSPEFLITDATERGYDYRPLRTNELVYHKLGGPLSIVLDINISTSTLTLGHTDGTTSHVDWRKTPTFALGALPSPYVAIVVSMKLHDDGRPYEADDHHVKAYSDINTALKMKELMEKSDSLDETSLDRKTSIVHTVHFSTVTS